MYSLLIVDDEIHAVEGVKSDLDLLNHQISKVYTAFNIRQAKEIFASHPIDIMLCDIEMPQGSGLQLLEWVKEHYPRTECIFLTNHAEFDYAKQAIKLGSLDYILKPVPTEELDRVLNKAIDLIQKHTQFQQSVRFKQLWEKHEPLMSELFWLDILNQKIVSHPQVIQEEAAIRNLPFEENTRFLPVLLHVQKWYKNWSMRDEKILEYALKNSAEELIIGTDLQGQIIELRRGLFLVILTNGNEAEMDIVALTQNCDAYIKACNEYLYCDMSCYIGRLVYAHQLINVVEELKQSVKNNVAYHNKVFHIDEITKQKNTGQIPDMTIWEAMLKQGAQDELIAEIEQFFTKKIESNEVDRSLLVQFHQSFLQMVYSVLRAKGIQAHQLFCDAETIELSDQALHHVSQLKRWVRHIIKRTLDHAKAVRETDSIIETVKRYIATHISDPNLSREEISSQVYLNPDYLSRMFKKETGYSISEYVLNERIHLAKRLLSETELTISAVASAVGYLNFSHFSKIFRKYTGLSPKDFRQQAMSRESAM